MKKHLNLYSLNPLYSAEDCLQQWNISAFQVKLQNNISYQMADIHRLKGKEFVAVLYFVTAQCCRVFVGWSAGVLQRLMCAVLVG